MTDPFWFPNSRLLCAPYSLQKTHSLESLWNKIEKLVDQESSLDYAGNERVICFELKNQQYVDQLQGYDFFVGRFVAGPLWQEEGELLECRDFQGFLASKVDQTQSEPLSLEELFKEKLRAESKLSDQALRSPCFALWQRRGDAYGQFGSWSFVFSSGEGKV